ncbi:hypothetical protein NE865_11576 [Phthorimaea operculella]|nr:hypothetical protein NE865_11576 [Phthorimaea operculella]
MPPKKNADDLSGPAKITKDKVARKRKPKEKTPKPEKPKLKVPSVVKLKLSAIKSFLTPPVSQSADQRSPKKPANKGNVSPVLSPAAKRKLDLANEVALAQLAKKPSPEAKKILKEDFVIKNTVKKKISKPSPSTSKLKKTVPKLPVAETEVNVPKKRGRKKKVIEPPEKQTSDAPINTAEESAPEPKKKRAYVRRKPMMKKTKSNSLEQDTPSNETSIRKADSTSTPTAKLAGKRQYIRRKIIKKDDCCKETSRQPEVNVSPDKVNAKKKDSRKPSTSVSECPSWTKDISSSSTTTCQTVTSNDFFRMNKRVPIIKLSHVENEWKNISGHKDDDTDSRCSDSSSSSSSSSSSKSQSSVHSVSKSLNLSTSSITPTKSNITRRNSTQSDSTKDDDWEYALQKLEANIKKLDIEAINWYGYENKNIDTTIDITQNKIFKLLKFENDLLKDCENFNNFFRSLNITQNNVQTDDKNVQLVVEDPNSYTSRSEEDENFTTSKGKYVMFDQNCSAEEDPMKVAQVCENKTSEEDIFNPDKLDYAPYEQTYNNDDDDTLSLFAESITGIESSRINSSANSVCANASELDEYIPQPIASAPPTSAPYVPTKIAEPEPPPHLKSKTVCEKQNADSTSIHREKQQQINTQPNTAIATSTPAKPKPNKIKLMSDNYRPITGVKSLVFAGYCFYNLISNCRKIRCIFPHIHPNNCEVRNRLVKLTNEVFIAEYMLLRNWPELRRDYAILYVSECIERKLTRILVEMCIDFISKAKLDSVEDAAMKINVTEQTLMYLNTVDFSECEDLLQHSIGKGILLCDVLMQTIGETQNFSRFKAAFVKLTDFITGMGRKFQLHVANQILERVCILPCEEALAFAVLAMVKNTDPKIFDNSMMSQFEKQLSSLDLVLYGKLCTLRQQAEETGELQRCQDVNEHSTQIDQEVDQMGMNHIEREERYTSPDTTKMDTSNKPPEDHIPQKVIRPSIFNHIFNTNQSANSSPSSEEDKRPAKFRTWRGEHHNQNYMRNQGNIRFNRPMRPPMRGGLKRRGVAFGPQPPKFPRRSGPDFF